MASASREVFGTLADGTAVEAVTLTGGDGIAARVLAFGATLQAFTAPDRAGQFADIVLGFADLATYVERPGYFGPTVGRYANRIAGGRFALDGRTWQLSRNDGANALHGGADGFDRALWRIVAVEDGAEASVRLALTSPDGDQGFPGTLTAEVRYALDDRGALTIEHRATSDAPTIVNMTNHALFNLAGPGSPDGVLGHRLTIPASRYVPVDTALIPTGELADVAGTAFDFTSARELGERIRDGRDSQIVIGRGYDHSFALDQGLTAEPKLAARLHDPGSGRVLEVLTTEPGIQIYSGNVLDGSYVGKSGHAYRMGDGIALEPQKHPDTPNRPAFGSARLDPGETYRHTMIYRVSLAA